jgi:hypothetical protein
MNFGINLLDTGEKSKTTSRLLPSCSKSQNKGGTLIMLPASGQKADLAAWDTE